MKRNADQIPMEELEAESYHLFTHFNSLYFDGALEFCTLKWSSNKSMHRSTGICNYVSPGECEIFLSKPLLQSCSIDDLKNSLLHQMIHAFLWIKYENKNHSVHGSNFQNMRNAINSSSVDDQQRPCSGYNVPLDHKHSSLSNCMFSKTYNHVQWMCDTCGLRTRKLRAPSDKDCVSKVGPAMPCNNTKCLWHNHKSKCAGIFTVSELQAYKGKKVNSEKVTAASNGTQDHNAKKMNLEKTVVSDVASIQDRTVDPIQGKTVLLLPFANPTKICKGPRTRCTRRREIYKKDLQQSSKNVVHEDESIPPLTNKGTERRKKMKLMQMAMKETYEKMRKEEENEDKSDEGNECDTRGLRTRKSRAPSDKDCVSKVCPAVSCNNQNCLGHNHKSKCAGTFTVTELQAYEANKVNSDKVVASNGTQDHNAKKMNLEKTVVSNAASVQDKTVKCNQGKTVLLLPFENTTKICKVPRTGRTKRGEMYKKDLQQRSEDVVHEDEDEEEDESIPSLVNKRTERRKQMKLMRIAMKETYEKMRKEEENEDESEGNECDTHGLRTINSGAPSDKDCVSKVCPAVSCNDQNCVWHNDKSKCAGTSTVAELQAYKDKNVNSDKVAASNGTLDHNAKKMNLEKTVVSNGASVQDKTVKCYQGKTVLLLPFDENTAKICKGPRTGSENVVHEDEDEEEDESIPPLVNKRTERRKMMKLMQIAMKQTYERMRKEEEDEDESDEGNEV